MDEIELRSLFKRTKLELDRVKVDLMRCKHFPPKACVFFSTLLEQLVMLPSLDCPTMGTDGVVIIAHPEFVLNRCTRKQRATVGLHEVLHCADDHMAMGMAMETGPWDDLWQKACDCAVNCVLMAIGGDLPGNPELPSNYGFPDFLSAVEYYNLFMQRVKKDPTPQPQPQPQPGAPSNKAGTNQSNQQSGQQPGQQPSQQPDNSPADQSSKDTAPSQRQPKSVGEVYKHGVLAEKMGIKAGPKEGQQMRWQIAIAQANMVAERTKGDMPGPLRQWIDKHLKPQIPWQQELDEFAEQMARDEHTWNRPNKHFMSQNIYLPAPKGFTLPQLGILMDTSGSITPDQQALFLAEMFGIMELNPLALIIGYHTTEVYHQDRWEPGDPEYVMPDINSGGTSHVPCFEQLGQEGDDIKGFICLTDCYTDYPELSPDVPVIWCVVNNDDPKPPFGRVLKIRLDIAS